MPYGHGMPRLFVAAWPPQDVVDRLAELDRPAEPGVRWTRADQWHVTLRFLGSADPDDAVAALQRLGARPAVATLGPRVSRLGRAVIVAPVAGLDQLAGEVRRITADVGEPADPRPFAGHITLARVRARGTCGLAGTPIGGSFVVEEVALVVSDTRPDGARYADIARFPLERR